MLYTACGGSIAARASAAVDTIRVRLDIIKSTRGAMRNSVSVTNENELAV